MAKKRRMRKLGLLKKQEVVAKTQEVAVETKEVKAAPTPVVEEVSLPTPVKPTPVAQETKAKKPPKKRVKRSLTSRILAKKTEEE
tara:strand:+ start:220 stop:474 length:255 start_codon:yes stop_codon:yes gene_type:complete